MGVNVIQLTSKSHHENVLASLQQLRTAGHLTDVTVQVDDQGHTQEFQAHKLMLAASSGYFKTALLSQAHGALEKIPLPTVHVEHFSKFLEFVYTGKVELMREKIGDVLGVAECLDCKDLAEVCREALTAGIVHGPAAAIYEPVVGDAHELRGQIHGKTSQGVKRKRQPKNPLKQPVQTPETEVRAKRGKARTPPSGESRGKKQKVGPGGRKVVQRRTARQRQTYCHDSEGSNEDLEDVEDGAELEDQQEKEEGDASTLRIPPFDGDDEDWEPGERNQDSDGAARPPARDGEDKGGEESKEGRKKTSKAQFQCNKCQRTFHYERSYLKHIRYSSAAISRVVLLKTWRHKLTRPPARPSFRPAKAPTTGSRPTWSTAARPASRPSPTAAT